MLIVEQGRGKRAWDEGWASTALRGVALYGVALGGVKNRVFI